MSYCVLLNLIHELFQEAKSIWEADIPACCNVVKKSEKHEEWIVKIFKMAGYIPERGIPPNLLILTLSITNFLSLQPADR